MATSNELDIRLTSHVDVCEIRYEAISARLKRIEQIGISIAGFIIALLLHIILKA